MMVGKGAHLEQIAPSRFVNVREGRGALEGEGACMQKQSAILSSAAFYCGRFECAHARQMASGCAPSSCAVASHKASHEACVTPGMPPLP